MASGTIFGHNTRIMGLKKRTRHLFKYIAPSSSTFRKEPKALVEGMIFRVFPILFISVIRDPNIL